MSQKKNPWFRHRAVFAIAKVTWLEAIRSRLLLLSLMFGVVLVALSVAAASVSVWERARLIVDVGLSAMSVVGAIMAAVLTINTFASDIHGKGAYPLLTRPIARWELLTGRFLGNWSAVSVAVLVMGIATAATITLYGDNIPNALWWALVLAPIEMGVVCGIAALCSVVSSPSLAAGFTAGIWLVGSLSRDLLSLGERLSGDGNEVLGNLLAAIYYLAPDLGALSLRSEAANDLVVADGFVTWACIYGFTYTACVIGLASVVLTQRKSF